MSETLENMHEENSVISLTDRANAKVKELMALEEDADTVFLRVDVEPGGCAGMTYGLSFDNQSHDDDCINDSNGVKIHLHEQFIPMLKGTTIDWVDSLQGAGFHFENPNMQQGCGCGKSFC